MVRIITFFVLCFISADALQAAPASFLPLQTFQLKNGMKVVVLEDHRAPIVYHSVWYRVGAADEDPSRPRGLAHFCEHLMFKGTVKHPGDALNQALQKMGGRHNAFTSWDYTAYYEIAAAQHLETLMELEADRMMNLQLKTEDVVPERQVVSEERRMRAENEHRDQLQEKAFSCLFTHHSYGTPILGWHEDIQSYSTDNVREFYQKWYHPGQAILIVAGDVTVERVRAGAEKYFGGLPAHAPSPRHRLKEPSSHQTTLTLTRLTDQTQLPHMMVYERAPTITSRENLKTPAAWEVAAKILGGGRTSRLYISLVQQQKLASSASASYMNLRDHGVWMVSLEPRAGLPLDTLRRAYEKEMAGFKTHPVTTAEVEKAKNYLLGQLDYMQDNLETAAYIVGSFVASDLDLALLEAWPDAIRSVSAQDVQKILQELALSKATVNTFLEPLPPKPSSTSRKKEASS